MGEEEQPGPSTLDLMRAEYIAGQKDPADPNETGMSMFGLPSEDNLIRWQLDMKEDLDRIYHLLKGDQIKEDAKGIISYVPATHDDLKPFNEFGVQMIMNIMMFYLNRNTLLSNYDEPTIKEKVLDFGRRLSVLIHNRYEEIMMTVDLKQRLEELTDKKIKELPSGVYVTDFKYEDGVISYNELPKQVMEWKDELKRNHLVKKMKMYEMMVGSLVDSVHSAYLRAYKGGERDSLRTARQVHQTEPIMNNYNQPPITGPQVQQKKFSIVNPRSWG